MHTHLIYCNLILAQQDDHSQKPNLVVFANVFESLKIILKDVFLEKFFVVFFKVVLTNILFKISFQDQKCALKILFFGKVTCLGYPINTRKLSIFSL